MLIEIESGSIYHLTHTAKLYAGIKWYSCFFSLKMRECLSATAKSFYHNFKGLLA